MVKVIEIWTNPLDKLQRFINKNHKKTVGVGSRCCGCIWKPSSQTVTSNALIRCQPSQLLVQRGGTWAAARRSEEPHRLWPASERACLHLRLLKPAINEPLFAARVCSWRRLKRGAHYWTLHQTSCQNFFFFFKCRYMKFGFSLRYCPIRLKANKTLAPGGELNLSWSGFLGPPSLADRSSLWQIVKKAASSQMQSCD